MTPSVHPRMGQGSAAAAQTDRGCVSVRDKERAVTGEERGEGGTGAVVAAAQVR